MLIWSVTFEAAGMCRTVMHFLCLYNRVMLQVRVRFNAEEAIEELLWLNLILEQAGEGDDAKHYTAAHPAEASEHLTSHWRDILLQRVDSRIQHMPR